MLAKCPCRLLGEARLARVRAGGVRRFVSVCFSFVYLLFYVLFFMFTVFVEDVDAAILLSCVLVFWRASSLSKVSADYLFFPNVLIFLLCMRQQTASVIICIFVHVHMFTGICIDIHIRIPVLL